MSGQPVDRQVRRAALGRDHARERRFRRLHNAAPANNHFRRSTGHPVEYARTPVQSKASIGANATILAGVVAAADAMIGAGVVVTRDVPPTRS